MNNKKYFERIEKAWDNKTKVHVDSDFYDTPNFLKGKSSLQEIELDVLKNIEGKSILHLQCHFGQDSISLARMGADVTACDMSSEGIKQANILAEKANCKVDFICCNIYNLKEYLVKKFDIVFTSYGVICWLPDLDKWANIISHFLKPYGRLVFAEFHPMVNMLDDDYQKIVYSYFNEGAIEYYEEGTYADASAPISDSLINWSHSLGEIFTALLDNGISINKFQEYNYSPFNCFPNMIEGDNNRYIFEEFGDKLPLTFLIEGKKI